MPATLLQLRGKFNEVWFILGFFMSGFAGIPQSLTGAANSGLSVGTTSLITGSNSDFPDLQKNMPIASESLALSGLAGMGLPTSPVSISSTIVNSMVNQQGNSPLSRLEQQVSCSYLRACLCIPKSAFCICFSLGVCTIFLISRYIFSFVCFEM